jgi:2-dehydro-3-deoxygluconokinase
MTRHVSDARATATAWPAGPGTGAGAARSAGEEDIVEPVDVVTIGETMVMLVPREPVPLAEASSLSLHIGGAESNVATYLAEFGHRVRWLSRVGDDPFGDMIVRQLAGAGVDTTAVIRVRGGRTGLYVKDTHAGATTVHYYRDGSPAWGLAPAALGDPLLDRARVLHLSGITAALSASARELVLAAVRERREPAPLVSFDVNYRSQLWPVPEAAPLLARIADASDLVFVGLDEAQTLWGCREPGDVRSVLPSAERLVVKDGSVGAYCFGPGGDVFVPAPRVTVVEPVGAGDAFAAGYLSAVLTGEDEKTRLRLGHLVAAAALSTHSDHARLPGHDVVRARLDLPDRDWARLDLTAPSSHDGTP